MKIKFKKLFFITGLLIIGLAVLTWGISCLWGIYCFHHVKNQKNEQGISKWAELEQNVLSRPAGTNLFDLSPWKEWLEAKIADPDSGDGELNKYSTIRSDFIENALTNLNELITQYQISSQNKRKREIRKESTSRYKKLIDDAIDSTKTVLTKKTEFDQLMADSEEYKKLTSQQQAAKFCLFLYSKNEPLRDKIKKNLKLAQYEAIPESENFESLTSSWSYIRYDLIKDAANYARIYAILGEREKTVEELSFLLDLVTLEQCANSISVGHDRIGNYYSVFLTFQRILPYHTLSNDDLLQLEERLAKIAYVKDFQMNLLGEVYRHPNTNFDFETFLERCLAVIFYGELKQGDAKYLQYFWDVYSSINTQEQTIDEEKWEHFLEPYIQVDRKFHSLRFDKPGHFASSVFTIICNADNIKPTTESSKFDFLKGRYNRLKVFQNHAITSCALECYYLKNKRYPGKLEDLIPDYLETIPENILHPDKDSPYQSDGKSYSFGTFEF
jgi:hypothetical protein